VGVFECLVFSVGALVQGGHGPGPFLRGSIGSLYARKGFSPPRGPPPPLSAANQNVFEMIFGDGGIPGGDKPLARVKLATSIPEKRAWAPSTMQSVPTPKKRHLLLLRQRSVILKDRALMAAAAVSECNRLLNLGRS
jgi:hypothetical protein